MNPGLTSFFQRRGRTLLAGIIVVAVAGVGLIAQIGGQPAAAADADDLGIGTAIGLLNDGQPHFAFASFCGQSLSAGTLLIDGGGLDNLAIDVSNARGNITASAVVAHHVVSVAGTVAGGKYVAALANVSTQPCSLFGEPTLTPSPTHTRIPTRTAAPTGTPRPTHTVTATPARTATRTPTHTVLHP